MKRKILLSSLILVIMLIIGKASYATVEIIPSKTGDGKNAIVNISVSDSFTMCKGMKTNTGESLKDTGVDVHLATNKDWGAVSYLSNSIYGTNTTGGNTGITVTISGVNYYSTTTNITGIMNWGSNPNKTMYTQTAGLESANSPGVSSVTELYNNRETKYVEYIDPRSAANTKGMAIHETSGLFGSAISTGTWYNCPGSARKGLFSVDFGDRGVTSGRAIGNPANDTTFRPVIWN